MFKNITIQNFRGIKELKIEDFGRVNLLVGGNNSGKSSVLEAIALVNNMSNALTFFHLKRLRSSRTSVVNSNNHQLINNNLKEEDWNNRECDSMFNDTRSPIIIEADGDFLDTYSPRKIEISLRYNPKSILPIDYVNSVHFQFYLGHQKDPVSDVVIIKNEPLPNCSTGIPLISTVFIRHYIPLFVTDQFKELQSVPSKREEFFERFKRVYSFKDIRMEGDTIIFDTGIDKLLPLSAMGDGFISVFYLFLQMERAAGGIILIDEIDTGLHYSVMVDMWKGVLAASIEYNVQVFTTTHSYECIEALNEAYNEVWKGKEEDEIRVYRLQTNKRTNTLEAIDYEPEILDLAIEKYREIR